MQTAPLYTENLTAAMYNTVPYKNTTQQAVAPEGYMTGDEFERKVKAELKQLYLKNGLL
jgi:hypothetical protein